MYAIIETGGKQYRVQEGDLLYIEKLDADAESSYTFDKVLAVGDGDSLKIGAPLVDGASVTSKILKHGKAKKITVFTYRAKKNSKRKMGHRQQYTQVEVTAIKG